VHYAIFNSSSLLAEEMIARSMRAMYSACHSTLSTFKREDKAADKIAKPALTLENGVVQEIKQDRKSGLEIVPSEVAKIKYQAFVPSFLDQSGCNNSWSIVQAITHILNPLSSTRSKL